MSQPSVPEIGRSMHRTDAAAKVSGAEKYAADWYGEETARSYRRPHRERRSRNQPLRDRPQG